MTANIVDLPPGFPARLRDMREKRYQTQTDLAVMAGISPRSIHELESGRRERALVKTIMLVAQALEVSYEDLVKVGVADAARIAPPESTSEHAAEAWIPRATRRKMSSPLIALLAAIAMIPVAVAVVRGLSDDVISIDEAAGVIEVHDDLLKRLIWRRDYADAIWCWRLSPWDDDVLLVGFASETDEGGGSRP